jgi:hypothetical protein
MVGGYTRPDFPFFWLAPQRPRRKLVFLATVIRELTLVKHPRGTVVPKYLDSDPLAGLQLLRVPDQDVCTLGADEETRLLEHATDQERVLVISRDLGYTQVKARLKGLFSMSM